MEEGMIQAQVIAARLACARITVRHLEALQDSVERACGLAGRCQWDRKAAAHAEIFGLLADVADDPVLAPVLRGGPGYVRELIVAVGCWRTCGTGTGRARRWRWNGTSGSCTTCGAWRAAQQEPYGRNAPRTHC
jgi:hypothetical protein